MNTEIKNIDTLSEFKKNLKKFVKAAFKLPVEQVKKEDGETIVFDMCKEIVDDNKIFTLTANGTYATFTFTAVVSTRIYNKADVDFVTDLVTAAIKSRKNAKAEVNA